MPEWSKKSRTSLSQAAELDSAAAFMRTRRRIDAGVGQSKAFDGFIAQEMRLDDLVHVVELDETVPDLLGIDDHGDAVLALIEAAGLIDAHLRLQPVAFDGGFERLANGRAVLGVTTSAMMAGRPLVHAHKYMSFQIGHEETRSVYFASPHTVAIRTRVGVFDAGQDRFGRSEPSPVASAAHSS